MKFISIGPTCGTVTDLLRHNLREESYPFDYLFSSLEMVQHCIEDEFNIFLDKKYFIQNEKIRNSIQHSFYSNFITTDCLKQHHLLEYKKYVPKYIDCNRINKDDLIIIEDSGEIIISKFPRDIFLHFNLFDNNIYESFVRKCNRFMNIIKNEQVCLVYTNPYNKNIDDIIRFSEYVKKYKNIFLIGILQNNDEPKIIQQSPISNDDTCNCKIYQNYDYQYIISDVVNVFGK